MIKIQVEVKNITAETRGSSAVAESTEKSLEKSCNQRPIRSFVMRSRKLPSKKQQVINEVGTKYLLDSTQNGLDFTEIFAKNAPLILEIGFGMGENLLNLAKNFPHKNFLGIEVHKPGVAAVLLHLQESPLDNIRIYEHDAVEILRNCVANNSVEETLLYFPDPWPKRRHHKRRIVQKDFARLIVSKLREGGKFKISTDCEDYATHCLKILSQVKELTNASSENEPSSPLRQGLTTKFERRGIKLGHKICDLIFVKTTKTN